MASHVIGFVIQEKDIRQLSIQMRARHPGQKFSPFLTWFVRTTINLLKDVICSRSEIFLRSFLHVFGSFCCIFTTQKSLGEFKRIQNDVLGKRWPIIFLQSGNLKMEVRFG